MKRYVLDQLEDIAAIILKKADHKVFLFYGDMGVGKTTLIKEIIKLLGVQEVVSSPTFSLVNEYRSPTGEPIFHFDFYRLQNESEALDIGIEDYFSSEAWCFIEWPEKVKNLLPLNAVEISLSLNEDGSRELSIN